MKFIIFSSILFLSFITKAAVTDIDCDTETHFESINQFSEKIFESPLKEMPQFYQDWMSQTLDKNQDKVVDAQEYKDAACRLSKNIYDITGKLRYEYPIFMNGQVNFLEYWAYDNKISSGAEFEIAMGKEARDWLFKYFLSQKQLPLKYRSDILEFITSGEYTVTAQHLANQVDLAGVDVSVEGVYTKALKLTYLLDKLIQNHVPGHLLNSYFKHAAETKTFAYIESIHAHAIDAFVHSYSKVGIGPKEAYHFYVMEQVSVKMTANGVIWGQPKNQHRYMLRDPRFMVVLSRAFEKRISKTLDVWTSLGEFEDLVDDYYETDVNTEEGLHKWLQSAVNQLADIFWQEPLTVSMFSGPSYGRNAYLDGQTIYISSEEMLNLQSLVKDAPEEFIKHLLNVTVQEWVHYLQRHKPDLYADNNAFYNDGVVAYQIFGNEGVRWYKDQPIEKDAHEIANGFVLRTQNKLER